MDNSFQVFILTLPFLMLVVLRGHLFSVLTLLVTRKYDRYHMSSRVSIGLVAMLLSIPIGVYFTESKPGLSVSFVVGIVVIICCSGALILATGVRNEWERNRLR